MAYMLVLQFIPISCTIDCRYLNRFSVVDVSLFLMFRSCDILIPPLLIGDSLTPLYLAGTFTRTFVSLTERF